jgi:hypothetical protein
VERLLTLGDVAEVLGVPVGAVHLRYRQRGLEQYGDDLEEYEATAGRRDGGDDGYRAMSGGRSNQKLTRHS